MSNETFNLVFRGELVRGCDPEQSKRNLGQLFKISGEQVESLFSGEAVVLKKNLDFATANKYRVAIKKAGCRVDLVETQQAQAPKPKEKAVFTASDLSSSETADRQSREQMPVSEHQASVRDSEKENRKSEEIEAPDYGLAPAGADVLTESEKAVETLVDIDVANLSVKDMQGDLLEASEKKTFVARDLAPEGVSLAPAGGDLLQEAEREKIVAIDIDVSDLSLADVGADLGQEKGDERELVIPDTSGLSLVPDNTN